MFFSGLAGLLRKHKTVDEYGAGFDTSKKLPKNLKTAQTKKPKLRLADRLKKPVAKISVNKKRDMSVFDD